MIRNLKALGLALVAVLAMSAFAASASQAKNLTTETGKYPATITAGQKTLHEFTVSGRVVTCATASFTGTLSAASKELTVAPTYTTCHTVVFGETWPVTVTTNGCHYLLTNTPENQIHLTCAAGQGIEIHIYTSHANHTAGTSVCTYKVDPQTISTGVSYENTATGSPGGKGAVDIKAAASPIVTTRTGGSELLCGPATQNATYTGVASGHATIAGVDQGLHLK